jgi:hypothetical protein
VIEFDSILRNLHCESDEKPVRFARLRATHNRPPLPYRSISYEWLEQATTLLATYWFRQDFVGDPLNKEFGIHHRI